MAIRKQEFYEGAALHRLAREGGIRTLSYAPPFFTVNGELLLLLKYSTRTRSPWRFTFTPQEQTLLATRILTIHIAIGLVCGSDGVATVKYPQLTRLAAFNAKAFQIACYRDYDEHYEIFGPDGVLSEKIPPRAWTRLITHRGSNGGDESPRPSLAATSEANRPPG